MGSVSTPPTTALQDNFQHTFQQFTSVAHGFIEVQRVLNETRCVLQGAQESLYELHRLLHQYPPSPERPLPARSQTDYAGMLVQILERADGPLAFPELRQRLGQRGYYPGDKTIRKYLKSLSNHGRIEHEGNTYAAHKKPEVANCEPAAVLG
jgi:hypothetical protein